MNVDNKNKALTPELVKAVIQAESNFDVNAKSDEGAKGLMQLMDRTATEMEVTDSFDPEQNVQGGIKYLNELLNKYNGDVNKALAAYNYGPGNIDKTGTSNLPQETTNFIISVLLKTEEYKVAKTGSGQTGTSTVLKTAEMESFIGVDDGDTANTLSILKAKGAYTTAELNYNSALQKAVEAKQKYDRLSLEGKYSDAAKSYENYLKYKELALTRKTQLDAAKDVLTDAEYDKDTAFSSISGTTEEQNKAFSYLENLVNNPDTSDEEIASVFNSLKRKTSEKAKELADEIEADIKKEEKAKQASGISGKEVTWDKTNNKFKLGSQSGDAITIAINGEVKLYDIKQAPTEAETTEDRKDLSQDFIDKLPETLQNNLEVDGVGNIYDTSTGEWIIGLKTNQKTSELELEKKIPDYLVVNGKKVEKFKDYESNGQGIFKDADGKLFNQLGREIPDGTKINEPTKIGDIESQLTFEVKDGKIDTSNPVSAKISGIAVSVNSYSDILSTIESVGGKKVIGSLIDGIQILDDKNELKAKVTQGEYEGVDGIKIEKDYVSGVPLSTKTTSTDGKTTITEEKEYIEQDTGKKDKDGKAIIKEVLRTKNWVKVEKTDEEIKGEDGEVLYTLTKITERKYDTNKETGKETEDYTEITTDSMTGEPLLVMVKKGNNVAPDNEKLNTLKKQFKTKQFFSTLDFALTEFQGLGYYATWFMSDEALESWRESVDKTFATMYLGTEYWASAICSSNIDRDQKGVAYIDTKSGLAGVAAHIEASKSGPIINQTATEYLYKITFMVTNGDWENDPKALEEMEFNVYLYGEKEAKLMNENKKLKKGESFGIIRSDAIVQYSQYDYDKICISFKDVPSFWSLTSKELCNEIQGPSEKADKIEEDGTAEQTILPGEEESEFLQI